MDQISVAESECLIINNYFGVLDSVLAKIVKQYPVLVDNSQAYYSSLIGYYGSFNSMRKFFGVADGAEAILGKKTNNNPTIEKSRLTTDSFSHLLGRALDGPESNYERFRTFEKSLKFTEIRSISSVSERIMTGLDHQKIKSTRRNNFETLDKVLRGRNALSFGPSVEGFVPMVYPFLSEDGDHMRRKLREHRIYCAQYWRNSSIPCSRNSVEHQMVKNLVALPIDQRYSKQDMLRVLEVIDR